MLVAEGGDPAEIAEREGLAADRTPGELEAIVERAIEAEPDAAEKVRAGNEKAIGPIVGAVMRETKGRADGGEVTRLIREKLGLAVSTQVRSDTLLQCYKLCYNGCMAWNVVIAGGGFGGLYGGPRAGALLPKQSTRLILVNDVNFLLYTPFLPEAAAGTLEPRHVVTPLRDILKRTYLRLGAVTGHDPGGAHGRAATHEGEVEELRYDQLLLAVGSVSRLAADPGPRRARDRVQEPRRRDLASQPRGRDARGGERDRGPGAAARSCSPTCSSAAATPGSRRWPSCRTSRPTR